jgi:hypothetical protein
LAITKSAYKHQYCGNGQCAPDLACFDHVYAIGNWQPYRSSNLSCVRLRTANLSEFAGGKDIGWIQNGIHARHVVNQSFNFATGIPRFFKAFASCGIAQRFAGLCAPAWDFKGGPASEEPMLPNKQYFSVPQCEQADPGAAIVDEKYFLQGTDAGIDPQDGLVAVPVFEALFQYSGFGHIGTPLAGKYIFNPGGRELCNPVSTLAPNTRYRETLGKSNLN